MLRIKLPPSSKSTMLKSPKSQEVEGILKGYMIIEFATSIVALWSELWYLTLPSSTIPGLMAGEVNYDFCYLFNCFRRCSAYRCIYGSKSVSGDGDESECSKLHGESQVRH